MLARPRRGADPGTGATHYQEALARPRCPRCGPVGRCRCCGRWVQPGQRAQPSDALDAAAIPGEATPAGRNPTGGHRPPLRACHHQRWLAQQLRRCRNWPATRSPGRPRPTGGAPHPGPRRRRALDRDAGALDASQLAAEARGGAAVDRTGAGPPAPRPPPAAGHHAHEREHLSTFLQARRAGHHLARRAGHPPAVVRPRPGRQPHPAGPRHLAASPGCYTPPASKATTHRVAHSPATNTSTDPGQPHHPWTPTNTPAISIRTDNGGQLQ